jgi:hypothetical protein
VPRDANRRGLGGRDYALTSCNSDAYLGVRENPREKISPAQENNLELLLNAKIKLALRIAAGEPLTLAQRRFAKHVWLLQGRS